MRSHLSVLTTLWIVTGLVTFPIVYLLLGFANDNPTALTRMITSFLVLFYLQLIIQSFMASASLKRIEPLKQYLFAVLIILLSPILLLICIPIGMHFSSNLILQCAFIATLAMQLAGSVWMWILIATRGKTLVVHQEEQLADGVLPHELPAANNSVPSSLKRETYTTRRKIAHLLLKLPIMIFVVIVALTIIVSIVGTYFPSLPLSQSPIFNLVFSSLGGIFALSVLPCLAAGIYLLMQKGK